MDEHDGSGQASKTGQLENMLERIADNYDQQIDQLVGTLTTLLEPIMMVDVVCPESVMGQIIGDLNSRRGQIESNIPRGSSRLIRAYVPLAEMFGYTTAIRSLSQGRAASSMEPARYEQVPRNIAEGLGGGRK